MYLGKVIIIGIAMAASLPAQAQPNLEQRFARLDTDRNGEITWAEAYRIRAMEFIELDRNSDGLVEKDEFRGRASPFEQFDANADGKLELSEYLAHHRKMFDKADSNGNGTLDLQEYEKIQRSIRSGTGPK